MRKKLLSLLLVVCMVLTLAPAALADNDVLGAAPGADSGVRETDFLDEHPHGDVDYEDMEIVELTEEEFLAAIDDVKALIAANAANETVLEAFHKVTDMMDMLQGSLTLLNIRNSADVNDEASQEAYKEYEALYYDLINPFMFLIQDMLKSDCRDYLVETDGLTVDEVAAYEAFEEISEEETALQQQITDYQLAYSTAAGEEDEDTMLEMFLAVRDANIESLKFYDGYDTYPELAYADIFGRDYTLEEAQAFFEAVKTYIVPLAKEYDAIAEVEQEFGDETVQRILYDDYTTDETLELIRPYLGKMSSELLEAWDYMIGHHLYDIGYTDAVKDGRGFTTFISGYNAPFFFNTPTGLLYDFTTVIHEFGHYNHSFSQPTDWAEGTCSFDVAEVHSQALELLFTQFYDDIFDEYAYVAKDYVIDNIIMSVIQGSLIGELELYAYSSSDVTADMIDEKYEELQAEYGLNLIPWVEIPHLTIQPLYYISYATSGIGALSFWNVAQEQGYDAATDLYLEFVAEPYYGEFQAEFEDILSINPMDTDYIAELAETLYEALDVEEKLTTVTLFPDVPVGTPYITNYMNCCHFDLIHGDADGLFHPDRSATRAEAVQAFYNLLCLLDPETDVEKSPFTDISGKWYEDAVDLCAAYGIVNGTVNEKGELVFDGDAPITREELAVIAYRFLTLIFLDLPTEPNPELSGVSVSPWAADAMNTLANIGWLDTTADPKRVETRNTLVAFLNNTLVQLL